MGSGSSAAATGKKVDETTSTQCATVNDNNGCYGTKGSSLPPMLEVDDDERASAVRSHHLHDEWLTGMPSLRPLTTAKEQREVADVLGSSRNRRFALPAWAVNALSESCSIEEHALGSYLDGWQSWLAGICVVLSGEAIVEFEHPPSVRTQIAFLRRGDTFGWFKHDGEDASWPGVWMEGKPRIFVSSDTKEPLRVARMADDPQTICATRRALNAGNRKGSKTSLRSGGLGVNKMGSWQLGQALSPGPITAEFEGDDLSQRLIDLWSTSSPSTWGVCSLGNGFFRAHFLSGMWLPLLERLEDHREEMHRRIRRQFRVHDCFPLAGHQIADLTRQTMHLTELWYGTSRGGNLSMFYKWFMQSLEVVGVTCYKMKDIPMEKTSDGWSTIVDGNARANALKSKGGKDSTYVATGGLGQRQGRSAIDNTVLRNVFTPREARELLLGKKLRKVVCTLIGYRQKSMIRRLSQWLRLDLTELSDKYQTAKAHRRVRMMIQTIPPDELKKLGIDPGSFCFQGLVHRGSILAGFGQLHPDAQKRVWGVVRGLMGYSQDDVDISPAADAEDVWERFVAWCRDHPGEFFEGQKMRHTEVKILGMFAGKIAVVKRSVIERLTLARYFPISWVRTQPLWGVPKEGCFVVRPAGTDEASRVRANECPYATLHGMSLSAGGYACDNALNKIGRVGRYSMLMELQWVRDPSANVENWFLTDIEKIIVESWNLNPHAPPDMMLPDEGYVNVGQNPKVGSSIKQTQHTQLCEGSAKSYPILAMSQMPRYSKRLDASIDLVDVGLPGAAEAGLIVKVVTKKPAAEPILAFLVELRLRLLERFGGAEQLDFLVLCMSDEQGGFVIVFAPIPQLEQMDKKHPDWASWLNPMTGESTESAGLEEARVDFGKGVGHFLVAKPALREQLLAGGSEMLRRIWAFNRVPGCRAVVEAFIEEQELFTATQEQLAF